MDELEVKIELYYDSIKMIVSEYYFKKKRSLEELTEVSQYLPRKAMIDYVNTLNLNVFESLPLMVKLDMRIEAQVALKT